MNTWDWIFKFVQQLAWPATLIIVLRMFHPAISQLIARVNGVTSKVFSVTFSQLEEIRQSLPLPKVDALPAAKDIHKALKLPAQHVEKVAPCEGEIQIVDNLKPGLSATIETAWNRLITALENLSRTKGPTTADSLPRLLHSVRPCLDCQVLNAISQLADLHTHLLEQIDSAPDVPGVIAFLQTVDQVVFLVQDQAGQNHG